MGTISKQSGHPHVDVGVIMKGIKSRARDKSLEEELKVLKELDVKNIEIGEEDLAAIAGSSALKSEENFSDSLLYLNHHYSIAGKYNFVATHRKGIFGRIINKVLSKLFLAIKIFIDQIVIAQETFNGNVVKLFNTFSKKLEDGSAEMENLVGRLEEQAKRGGELAIQVDAISEQQTVISEKQAAGVADLACRLEEQAKRGDELAVQIDSISKRQVASVGDLAGRLGEQAKRGDELAVQIAQMKAEVLEQEQVSLIAVENLEQRLLYPKLDFDYKAFEDNFRGDQESLKRRQIEYVKFFHECTNVMDVGCGRGEFIQLLHENGTGAFGVEMDKNMVEECRSKGLNVVELDVVSHLRQRLESDVPEKVDGIFAAQVIEHLHMDYLIEMLKLSYELLVPDKFIVLESVNIKTLSTFMASVYLDPTHIKPIHPDTLKFLMESIGFKNVRFTFAGEFPAEQKLAKIEEKSENDVIYNRNIARLNEVLFGPQDYAIVAQR